MKSLCIYLIAGILFSVQTSAFAASKSMCQEKVLETNTVQGVYLGNECGDFCYSSIKLDNGETFAFICGDDIAEKIFSNKKGKRVSVTYDVEQFWNENANECSRIEVFNEKKTIGSQVQQNATNQDKVTSIPQNKATQDSKPNQRIALKIKEFYIGMPIIEALEIITKKYNRIYQDKEGLYTMFVSIEDFPSFERQIQAKHLVPKKEVKYYFGTKHSGYYFSFDNPFILKTKNSFKIVGIDDEISSQNGSEVDAIGFKSDTLKIIFEKDFTAEQFAKAIINSYGKLLTDIGDAQKDPLESKIENALGVSTEKIKFETSIGVDIFLEASSPINYHLKLIKTFLPSSINLN